MHVSTLGHIGTADGSSLVRIGETGVICGLKLSFEPTKESTDTKGSLGRSTSVFSRRCKYYFIFSLQC